jgi:CRP-like cAMP-binding protein
MSPTEPVAASLASAAQRVAFHLRKVDFLADVDDATLGELAKRAHTQTFARGAAIVSELESGADVYVLTMGEAEVSVDARGGERQVLGKLTPGSAFGEMSSLTGELRSATVTAVEDVEVLVIPDAVFDDLRARRPQIAVALLRVLASRLADSEEAIEALLVTHEPVVEGRASIAIGMTAGAIKEQRKGSLARVWRELVVAKKRDLAFLTLTSFVLMLLAVRVAVYASFRFDFVPKDVLRTAYMTGFTALVGSACASLLTFRPSWRRAIAVFYGLGLALILNELGVTLAFDIFFKDIHTADPNVPFDVERLYRRAEPLRAIAIGLVVLIQAAYLRRFYARAAFVVTTRLRGLVSRKGG